MEFEIIDLTTGRYPDMEQIARNEEWAKGLIYSDMEGFFIGENGQLILADECGNFAFCPHDRFKVISRERVHTHKLGHWTFTYEDCTVECSECGSEHYIGMYHQFSSNYCPNCGIKMDNPMD